MSGLTIVMYHYVRPLDRTRYPRIKGRDLEAFRRQLEYVTTRHRVVTIEDVVSACKGEAKLPPGAALLTFDDGFADHYQYVFPFLHRAGVQGAFYPPAEPVEARAMLDVHRLHFILASVEDPGELRPITDRALLDRGMSEAALRDIWDKHGQATRFDSAEVAYVKRVLQFAIPLEVRHEILVELFARIVSVDEGTFAEELYVSADQLGVMADAGMHIGSHGSTHMWMTTLTEAEQAAEIDQSLSFLERVGIDPSAGWTFCYPYGDFNESTTTLAAERGCVLGLTTAPRLANLGADDPMALPRLDTNDLPH